MTLSQMWTRQKKKKKFMNQQTQGILSGTISPKAIQSNITINIYMLWHFAFIHEKRKLIH